MRKAKMAGELSIIGVLSTSHSSLGVCTRSRTLALQRGSGDVSMGSASSYLQLRSRRLEKETGMGIRGGGVISSSSGVRSSKFGKRDEKDRVVVMVEVDKKNQEEVASSDPTAVMDAQGDSYSGHRRAAQIVRGSEAQRITKNDTTSALENLEMEEFFAQVERQQQMNFTRKYNFDISNDRPLPGRYEWVALDR